MNEYRDDHASEHNDKISKTKVVEKSEKQQEEGHMKFTNKMVITETTGPTRQDDATPDVVEQSICQPEAWAHHRGLSNIKVK